MARGTTGPQIIEGVSTIRNQEIHPPTRLECPFAALEEMNRVREMLKDVTGHYEVEALASQVELSEFASIVDGIYRFKP
ncbi:hypothetical protein MesoLj131c_05160 [Mesorhizobium sp. 131-3-5]|nr:hypothetical protein MesoLj131b_05550 [Mesorhizobium sp. 131-2-5]BCH06258.1 hypothetical protein MesoLj131c_05160 [Mesorhizobium sp. 131-3-5]